MNINLNSAVMFRSEMCLSHGTYNIIIVYSASSKSVILYLFHAQMQMYIFILQKAGGGTYCPHLSVCVRGEKEQKGFSGLGLKLVKGAESSLLTVRCVGVLYIK